MNLPERPWIEMGYDYMAFSDFHFLDDLQYKDAVDV